ncbi:Do family serine endopeptidase [Candidatus Bandiella euplotis]|uniref:Do family serine endopeptidase n=1 Tax=Candidatus Bandiella euplotis TaxID=1664265 RepID=A0ABZ0UNF0_9RICK|nr:Do family serine endopeptidase [Candidatus Bandiella woodruffii]WPX96796.1 Do family serine endopeptidase [Candidatus Bandiella woodruffii]
MYISLLFYKFRKISLLCFGLMTLFFNSQVFAEQNNSNSIADVIEKLTPAVVNISTTQLIEGKNNDNIPQDLPEEFYKFFEEFNNNREGFDNKPTKVLSLGSGFFIDDKGHIVTNNHVIDNAEEINITIGDNDGKVYKAKVIGKDKKTDLALLKIEVKEKLPFVRFGDSDRIRVGDSVIAIGNAFGFGGTVTSGIVSAKGRHLDGIFYEEFIQTDASINRGNSGGPMFNMNGEVIGVNTAIVSPSGGNVGIGFAIPSNTAKSIINQLIKGGKIQRGWLGIQFLPINQKIAKAFGLGDDVRGAIVVDVLKGSPAEKAGIKMSDIIVKFNGIALDKANKFPKVVASAPVNKKIPLDVIRKGNIVTLYVSLEFQKNDDQIVSKRAETTVGTTSYGISVANLTSEIRKHYNIDESIKAGVVITKLDKNSNAFKNGAKEGDVIITINQDEVNSAKQFKTLLTNIKLRSPKGEAVAILFISRKNNNSIMPIPIELD